MFMNYLIRNIPTDISQALNRQLSEQVESKRGHTSPRQSWLRALICIGALETERSIAAFELWQRAVQIARRRGEDDIRSEAAVRERLHQETQEFSCAAQRYQSGACSLIEAVNRLSNILYYAVQVYAHDGNLEALDRNSAYYCEQVGIPADVAFQCAAAKYRERAPRAQKDADAEYAAMQHILDQWQNSPKNA